MKTIVFRNRKPEPAVVTMSSVTPGKGAQTIVTSEDGVSAVRDTLYEAADAVSQLLSRGKNG